jgi:hypothetical protein
MGKNAGLFLLACLAGGCSDGCQNSAISTADAPTGELQSVLFRRDCGATMGFSSQVSVTHKGEAPSGAGNAFVADTDHDAASAASWGGPWVELRWLSPHSLLIRYDAKARVFSRNESVSGVTVSYEKVTR